MFQTMDPSSINAYLKDLDKVEKLKIDWEWMLVIGVFIGGYLSSSFQVTDPKMLFPRFGKSL